MKKQFSGSLCAVLFIMMSCGTAVPDNEYRIEGTLMGVPDSTVISLYQDNDGLLEMQQSDTVMDGRFLFSDTLSVSRNVFLLSNAPGFPSNYLEVWVAPGERVQVKGHDKLINLWEVQSHVPEQVELNGFTDCARDLLRQKAMNNLQRDSLMQVLKNGQQSGLDGKTFRQLNSQMDSLMRFLFHVQYQISQKTVNYMQTAPYSSLWLNNLEQQARLVRGASVADDRLSELLKDFKALEHPVKELYASLSDSVKQTVEGRRIYHMLYPPRLVNVGDAMVDGPLYDPEGKEHRLAEFKGKYILLDFWSRGCGPCLASIPELEKISDTYADRLAVVSISSDSETAWKEFLKEKGLKGHQWNELRNDGGGLAAAYKVQGIPHYVLIAPDGKVAAMWSGYGEGSLERKLKESLR